MAVNETRVTAGAQRVLSQIRHVVVGKDKELLWVLAAMLAGGHILRGKAGLRGTCRG